MADRRNGMERKGAEHRTAGQGRKNRSRPGHGQERENSHGKTRRASSQDRPASSAASLSRIHRLPVPAPKCPPAWRKIWHT